MPLYPFGSLIEVEQWQASMRSGGHQTWHLDAGTTALSFVSWLGYANINSVITTLNQGSGVLVLVGFRPNGSSSLPVISARIHLIRWGTGSLAPWEVVGTQDTTFSLTSPGYGAAVSSPVAVGGQITGVDESIRVTVRDLQAASPVGSYCCRPAGGSASPWNASVAFNAARGSVLTIAASTGGHVAAVERFTVTGVRAG
jgi:hypothetical protein